MYQRPYNHQAQLKPCLNCGEQVEREFRYCWNCGKKIGKQADSYKIDMKNVITSVSEIKRENSNRTPQFTIVEDSMIEKAIRSLIVKP